MIKINPIHAFKDNYIWIIHNEKYAVIIDPGIATPVIEYIRQYHLKLIAILITHHHHDHTGGNLELSQLFGVQIYGPLKETIPGMTDGLEEGNIISLPELSLNLTVLDIPGHTAGHIAYYDSNHLFCGDTLFSCGCGRIFEGTAQQMYHSLKKSPLYLTRLRFIAHTNIRFQIFISQLKSIPPTHYLLNTQTKLECSALITSLPSQRPWQSKNRSIPS